MLTRVRVTSLPNVRSEIWASGFRVSVVRFRVSGVDRVPCFVSRFAGLGFRIFSFQFPVSGFGFKQTGADESEGDELAKRTEQDLGFKVSGFGLQVLVSGFGFLVSGFGFRVSGFSRPVLTRVRVTSLPSVRSRI